MDLAAFSPKKFQLLNQASPRASERKRSLFPSSSPQSSDLGQIEELSSDYSDTYSPPLVSPSLSITPSKGTRSHVLRIDEMMRVANHLEFSTSPRRSPRNKEYARGKTMSVRKSPRKPSQNILMDRDNFDDCFTLLAESPKKTEKSMEFELSSDNFLTPNKSRSNKTPIRRSPRSASKHDEVIIKPNSFYGNVAPLLATNQTNRIQGMKCVFRPLHEKKSKAKAKLMFDEKPKPKKRERSRSMDVFREAKRRKAVFTGVYHAIPKPAKSSPSAVADVKRESIREKARKITDLSRTPYGLKKNKPKEGWEYTLRFTRPMRNEDSDNLTAKRKFFKTSVVRDSPTSSSGSSSEQSFTPPNLNKKRKLLDPNKDYLKQQSPLKIQINASEISDMIDDMNSEKQGKPIVDDILLRLEEDEEEKKKEAERQMLMNLLEDSSSDDYLSTCTASLDLNDSISSSGCSRFSLEEDYKENLSTPQRMLSTPNSSSTQKVLTDGTNSVSKKKWRGLGKGQLQIDAGQKRYGARQCGQCGMVYQMGEAEDEIQHTNFHNNLSTLRHAGWKNENLVGSFGMEYVIMVTGNDPKNWQQRALDVIGLVDQSLGITSEAMTTVMHNQKIFLYIAEKRVVGCVVTSPISQAYKMVSSECDVDLCSEESYPVKCGVNRVWTLYSHRRRGVASRLLDTVRCNFMYGYILPKEQIAFSIPTPDGKRFATKYMGSPNFFVYPGY